MGKTGADKQGNIDSNAEQRLKGLVAQCVGIFESGAKPSEDMLAELSPKMRVKAEIIAAIFSEEATAWEKLLELDTTDTPHEQLTSSSSDGQIAHPQPNRIDIHRILSTQSFSEELLSRLAQPPHHPDHPSLSTSASAQEEGTKRMNSGKRENFPNDEGPGTTPALKPLPHSQVKRPRLREQHEDVTSRSIDSLFENFDGTNTGPVSTAQNAPEFKAAVQHMLDWSRESVFSEQTHTPSSFTQFTPHGPMQSAPPEVDTHAPIGVAMSHDAGTAAGGGQSDPPQYTQGYPTTEHHHSDTGPSAAARGGHMAQFPHATPLYARSGRFDSQYSGLQSNGTVNQPGVGSEQSWGVWGSGGTAQISSQLDKLLHSHNLRLPADTHPHPPMAHVMPGLPGYHEDFRAVQDMGGLNPFAQTSMTRYLGNMPTRGMAESAQLAQDAHSTAARPPHDGNMPHAQDERAGRATSPTRLVDHYDPDELFNLAMPD